MTYPPENSGVLGRELAANQVRMTGDRISQICLDNARQNLQYMDHGQSLAALRKHTLGKSDDAIVIAAGPSIKRNDPISTIKKDGFDGAILATDSGMYYCLRNGVVPDLVVTVDPFPSRIVRWFGDPDLTIESLKNDDYYRRQDMDESFANEMRTNDEILELMERHASGMRIALSTSSAEIVVRRAINTGMGIYWWNPMLDDPSETGGLSHQLHALNGLPLVNAGGNVGAACWMMADAVLEKQNVAITGMDFAYYADTPYSATQYYYEAIDLVGEDNLDSIYIHIKNPHMDQWFYTDPAYYWYREAFLDMVCDGNCTTYNCTEGGLIFGDKIDFRPLASFLDRTKSSQTTAR